MLSFTRFYCVVLAFVSQKPQHCQPYRSLGGIFMDHAGSLSRELLAIKASINRVFERKDVPQSRHIHEVFMPPTSDTFPGCARTPWLGELLICAADYPVPHLNEELFTHSVEVCKVEINSTIACRHLSISHDASQCWKTSSLLDVVPVCLPSEQPPTHESQTTYSVYGVLIMCLVFRMVSFLRFLAVIQHRCLIDATVFGETGDELVLYDFDMKKLRRILRTNSMGRSIRLYLAIFLHLLKQACILRTSSLIVSILGRTERKFVLHVLSPVEPAWQLPVMNSARPLGERHSSRCALNTHRSRAVASGQISLAVECSPLLDDATSLSILPARLEVPAQAAREVERDAVPHEVHAASSSTQITKGQDIASSEPVSRSPALIVSEDKGDRCSAATISDGLVSSVDLAGSEEIEARALRGGLRTQTLIYEDLFPIEGPIPVNLGSRSEPVRNQPFYDTASMEYADTGVATTTAVTCDHLFSNRIPLIVNSGPYVGPSPCPSLNKMVIEQSIDSKLETTSTAAPNDDTLETASANTSLDSSSALSLSSTISSRDSTVSLPDLDKTTLDSPFVIDTSALSGSEAATERMGNRRKRQGRFSLTRARAALAASGVDDISILPHAPAKNLTAKAKNVVREALEVYRSAKSSV